jgi:hypothetical protein
MVAMLPGSALLREILFPMKRGASWAAAGRIDQDRIRKVAEDCRRMSLDARLDGGQSAPAKVHG